MVFPCSRILYRFFESLGLDITSVIFNRFKKRQQHTLFVISFYQKIIQMVDLIPARYTFNRKSFTYKFENWILSIFIWKIYLRSCFNLLINTNPRSVPLKNESILFFTRAPLRSCTIFIPTPDLKKEGSSETEQTMSSQEHPHSYLINIKRK